MFFCLVFLEYSMPPQIKMISIFELYWNHFREVALPTGKRSAEERTALKITVRMYPRRDGEGKFKFNRKEKKKKKVTRFHSVFPETPLGAVSQYTAVGFPPPTTSCKGYVGLKAEGSTHAGNDAAHGGINEKPQRGESFHTEAQLKGNL